MMTKIFIYTIDFSCQIKILLLNLLKLFKIPGFLVIFLQNSSFFFLISQILGLYSLSRQIYGFFMIPSFVASLLLELIYISELLN